MVCCRGRQRFQVEENVRPSRLGQACTMGGRSVHAEWADNATGGRSYATIIRATCDELMRQWNDT